jgi:hypothetical protein
MTRSLAGKQLQPPYGFPLNRVTSIMGPLPGWREAPLIGPTHRE